MKPLLALITAWACTLPGYAIEFIQTDTWQPKTNTVLTSEHWVLCDTLHFNGRSSNDLYSPRWPRR